VNASALKFTLRREEKRDWDVVERLTYHAFLDARHTDGNEALLVKKLRGCGAFVPELDFVAELDGTVVGNIMYAKSKIIGNSGEWETLTFGPVSVLPKYQKQGIGGALITKTLSIAREMGYRAVLILGDPGYYSRFGFADAAKYGITTSDGANFPDFMVLPLYAGALDGISGRLIFDDVYFTLDKAESDALNARLGENDNDIKIAAGLDPGGIKN